MLKQTLAIGASAVILAASLQAARADRLDLTFLPPDLPPLDVCNAPPEDRGEGELQQDLGDDTVAPQDLELVQFLRSDIRRYMETEAYEHFDFIQALIAKRAQLDPDFAGAEALMTQVDLFVAADRLDDLRGTDLLPQLLTLAPELSNNQRVRIGRYYLSGLAGETEAPKGLALITEAALSGNANALLDVLSMQLAGVTPENWDLLPEDTATLAFGGMIGQFNRGLCNRAERIAREYTDGAVLMPNPDLAFAWRKFAADMGGAEASWRVVEYQLSLPAAEQNDQMLLHYLRKAAQNGFSIVPEDVVAIQESGARTEDEIRAILGRNYAWTANAKRRSATPHLALDVLPITDGIEEDSPLLQYLLDIVEIPGAPGHLLTRLGRELLLRKGRWVASNEAQGYLARAARAGDVDAMLLLSELLIAQRDRVGALEQAERWLQDAVAMQGSARAMKALDRFYRCQHPNAPILTSAREAYDGQMFTDADTLNISPADLARLDPLRDPEAVARLQSDAVRGHGTSRGYMLQYLQSNVQIPDAALTYWAEQVSASDRAIEDFVVSEYELALTAGERSAAIELFRRAFLHVRAPVALELAVALVEHAGRDPKTAQEIEHLLSYGANRAEGASLRLLMRLRDDGRDAEFYQERAEVIEQRGDFLANMVAAPHVSEDRFDTYIARAISLMNCTSKDVGEISDAYVRRGRDAEAAHWLRIGLEMEHGNVLSRLGLSPRQMDEFDTSSVPRRDFRTPGFLAGNLDDLMRVYIATSDHAGTGFDPDAAGQALVALLDSKDHVTALRLYRQAHWEIRRIVEAEVDIGTVLQTAAEGGDSRAQLEYALFLRSEATDADALGIAANWMETAAMAGNADAMVELAQTIAFGLGRPLDRRLAVIWLEKAEGLGHRKARDLITTLTAAGLE